MKLLFFSIAISGAPVHATPVAELSLTPARACLAPPGNPGKLLNQVYPNASTAGNAPFSHQLDINGDGWCDWVSTAAQPPHRDGVALEQPRLKDFIFLGSKSGWRRFGNQQAIRSFYDQQHFDQPPPYDGEFEVSAFVSPLLIYAKDEPRPYVATISISQDVLDATAEDVVVYRWHDGFDTLLQVGKPERSKVVQFLQVQYCGKKLSLPVQSVAQAVCAR
ncbi:hypothetical protein GJ698_24310 [Pseudoduganella sp. FT26W]|uniref:VCBS repeat-containing protein n=1 Tax=Duganella aquatilis TaxID=2666082 RepID=A0A844D2A1_9BURK|nr:hypothetical protein [Duganella aquatilis]MRW87197.1 hypothetical protein [Duganella aquatilis]